MNAKSLQLGSLCLLTSTLLLGPGAAQNNMYYAATDGTVRALNIDTGVETASFGSNLFVGAIVGAAREIAFDPETRLLWYSATDNTVRSFNVDSLQAGPMIPGAIPGGAIGAGRHVFIDYVGRRLLVTVTDGGFAMYNLGDQSPAGSLPSAAFNDGFVIPRHLASDPRTGNMWFAANDGSFRELDMTFMQATGRVMPFAAGVQVGGNPGPFRHMVIDAARNLMIYAVTDGSMASIDLTTLTAGGFTISSGAFAGAIIGAGRIITVDSSIGIARAIPFGSGCAGTMGVPVLAPQGGSLPKTGSTFDVTLSNLPANQRAILILGLSNTMWFSSVLPMSLAPFGAPGCSLLVSGDFSTQVPNPMGTANIGIPIPSDPSLVGLHIYFQGYVEDPGANAFGVAVSGGLDITIGTR